MKINNEKKKRSKSLSLKVLALTKHSLAELL